MGLGRQESLYRWSICVINHHHLIVMLKKDKLLINRIDHPKTNGCCSLTRIFLLLRVQNQTWWLCVYVFFIYGIDIYFCKIDIFEPLSPFNTNDFEVNRRFNELIINSNQPGCNQPELLNDCSQLKTNQSYRLSTGELSKSIIWPCSYMSLFLF